MKVSPGLPPVHVRSDRPVAEAAGRFDDVSIVVPAHNEAHRIESRLRDLCETVAGAEIIVVANNCSDETERIVSRLARRYPQLKLVSVPFGIGKGGAVRVGFHVAERSVLAFVDADDSTRASEVCRLIDHLGDADCVIGSRWLPGSTVALKQNVFRRLASRSFNLLVRAVIGVKFADTQCGAKVVRRRAYERVAEQVETADFAFDVDLLFQLKRLGFSIREVPTVWADAIGSSLRASSAAPLMFASIVRLRLRHSPLRPFVPAIDRILDLNPVATRRSLRVLVLSEHSPGDDRATSAERAFFNLMRELEAYGRTFTWHHRDGAFARGPAVRGLSLGHLPIAFRYLVGLRNRYDCVIEIADGGFLWSPYFSLKPKIVYRRSGSLPYAYGNAVHRRTVPLTAAELDETILAACGRDHHLITRRPDGSWYVADRAERTGIAARPGPNRPAPNRPLPKT